MKTLFFRKEATLFILFSFLLLYGCVQKPLEEFELIIVTTDKIGDSANAFIPESIVKLLYPLEECKEKNYLPLVKIIRLDSKRTELSLQFDRKSFSGNPNNTRLIRRKIDKTIKDKVIGEYFSSENPVGYSQEGELSAFLEQKGKRSHIYYFASDDYYSDSFEGDKVYIDLDSLRMAINASFCIEPSVGKPIIVIINPHSSPPPPPDTSVFSSQLEEVLNSIGSQKFSFEERMDLIDPTLQKFFASQSVVRIVGNEGTLVSTQTAEQYLGALSGYVTMERLRILEVKKDSIHDKVYLLIVKEYHPTIFQEK